ncbi:MAG: peptide deformylase [Gammaproteobacteria bacterium]|jgi:peptide deformylase
MAVLEVLRFPDPRLRKIASPIERIDDSIKELAKDMLETMYVENGIGLAATQVNIQKRIIVIDLNNENPNPMILVNPKIISATGNEEMQEGCLSVPDVFETVQRSEIISVKYLTLDSKVIEQQADDLLAVCIQHEIDHLDGKLFIDYLSPLKRNRIEKRVEKQIKQDKLQVQLF